jgi:HPt (histidine-containing phosphotransfer) domain-containing protein
MSFLSEAALKNLQNEYVRGFAEKLTRMDKLLEIQDWTGIEREFHRFSGSGTTYKMPEISKFARAAELYLEKNTPPDMALIQGAVALFRKILEARQHDQVHEFDQDEIFLKIK